ncbi:MAG TPA: hypothetical protein QGH10_25540, partial [Armatimonadota bacterium]|nr:hypothetical protein [Armatimonadota bacterium]
MKLVSLMLLLAMLAGSAACDQWWQYRKDRRLSGRSSATGNIQTPAVKWSHSIAARETLLAAGLGKGPRQIDLPLDDLATFDSTIADWGVAGRYRTSWLDLDGTRNLTPDSAHYNRKIGKVLPDAPGLQMIETEPLGYPKVPGVYKGTVRLKIRRDGEWVTHWEVETDTLIWSCEPIFGDFDGDGANEIALLPWYRLIMLDAATGELKEQCNYLAEDGSEIPGHGGRAYGWFGAVDLNGDGQTEFVIVEDFIRYTTVIGRRNGKLERLWLKVWEPPGEGSDTPTDDETVVVRLNPEPLQDIDGDGVPEIVVSIFNQTQDNRWHITALDPLTGETKLDLPGQFLTGLRDATGDGAPELFCTAAGLGPRIPEPTGLSIVTCLSGAPETLWEIEGSAFVTHHTGHYPPHVNSGAALGGETILCGPVAPDQPSVFFTRGAVADAAGETEVTCWQASPSGRFRRAARWTGPNLEPLMTRADDADSILLRASAFEGESARVRCPGRGADTTAVASKRVPAPTSPVVVGRVDADSPPTLVVQGANETVDAFRPSGESTERLWRVPGRGMTCNNYFEGLLLADLTGDGTPSVVAGRRGEGDCARLAVLSLDTGQEVWHHDFPDFPGAPPPWNVPGLMYWQGGHFRDTERMDLLVQMRRVWGESTLFDGRTGEPVWKQTKGRPGRGFGRWWMSMYDFDGDGLEDILNIYPDMFCVARGTDGELLVAEEVAKYVDEYAYYADCIVADFLDRGTPQILYCHEFVTALLDGNGDRIWKVAHVHPMGWRNQAAHGDVDGDGKTELLFPGAMGEDGREFRCLDAATGEVRWSFPMPDEAISFPAVADMNGDGRDECVFTMGSTIHAVGN